MVSEGLASPKSSSSSSKLGSTMSAVRAPMVSPARIASVLSHSRGRRLVSNDTIAPFERARASAPQKASRCFGGRIARVMPEKWIMSRPLRMPSSQPRSSAISFAADWPRQ